MTLGAVVASAFAGPMSWKFGRKTNLWIGCALCIISDIIMMTTTSIGALYFGRLLIGLGNGLFMTFSQLYIQEVCPAKWRGLALAGFNTWVSVGSLVGTVVDNFTSTIKGRNCYLIPLGLVYVVPFFITVLLPFIP
jgi:SP family sugar:H+ symporter-like MFS transporter